MALQISSSSNVHKDIKKVTYKFENGGNIRFEQNVYYQQENVHQIHFAPFHSPAKFHKYFIFLDYANCLYNSKVLENYQYFLSGFDSQSTSIIKSYKNKK